MSSKIAVVTGANKGIGFAIVKELAKVYPGLVYLTARNEELGLNAVKQLEEQGVRVNFHTLDIDSNESIDKFASYLKNKYEGLDLLINNAAIAYLHQDDDKTPIREQVENTIRINFTSTLNVCNALFPLLRPHSRVVNISSRLGFLSSIKDENLREKLKANNLKIDDIVKVMNEYVELAKTGDHEKITGNSYAMSKVGINLLTKAQQNLFDKDPREDIIVNSVTPGYVATDMTKHKGHLTPEQGAQTPLYVALLPQNSKCEKGAFWADKQVIDWKDLNNKV